MAEEPIIGEVPRLQFIYKRELEVSFVATIAANTWQTLLSDQVGFPFQIIEAKMFFDNDHINQVRYYWHWSRTRSTSVTGPLSDDNLFGRVSLLGYFVGNGLMRKAKVNTLLDDPPYYLKLQVFNNNAFAIVANASLLIGEL